MLLQEQLLPALHLMSEGVDVIIKLHLLADIAHPFHGFLTLILLLVVVVVVIITVFRSR
jgi:hypothetical protein